MIYFVLGLLSGLLLAFVQVFLYKKVLVMDSKDKRSQKILGDYYKIIPDGEFYYLTYMANKAKVPEKED
jgi:hypothetical protein